MRWQKKLTKKELAHVREWGGKTLAGFKANREVHAKMKAGCDAQHPEHNIEPCWECKTIARKLGLEV